MPNGRDLCLRLFLGETICYRFTKRILGVRLHNAARGRRNLIEEPSMSPTRPCFHCGSNRQLVPPSLRSTHSRWRVCVDDWRMEGWRVQTPRTSRVPFGVRADVECSAIPECCCSSTLQSSPPPVRQRGNSCSTHQWPEFESLIPTTESVTDLGFCPRCRKPQADSNF
jgi:hypothetical protein